MRTLLTAALFGAVATLATAEDITVETARGPVAVQSAPETLVSLDLAMLDILDRLEIPVAGVAGGVKPEYLTQYGNPPYKQLGSFFEPDLEGLNALSPDLAIVAGRSASAFDNVSSVAPTIDLTAQSTDLFGSLRRNMTEIGSLYGKEDMAAELLADLDSRLATLRQLSSEAGTALVIITTGGRMSTHGAEGRFAIVFNEMGFAPAIKEVKAGNHGQPISNEFILETNPDWVFVVDRDAAIGRDGQPAAQMLDNALVAKTKAAQADQIIFLDPADWYLVGAAGPTALERAMTQIMSALQD